MYVYCGMRNNRTKKFEIWNTQTAVVPNSPIILVSD